MRSISPGSPSFDCGEALVDELLDAGMELLDHARSEDLRHQSPQPVMIGRIEVQHRVRFTRVPLFEHRLELGVVGAEPLVEVALLDAQARVAQDAVDVFVAEERPNAERTQVHGVLVADQCVLRVRIIEEAGLERVEHRREVAGVGRLAGCHERHATPESAGMRA
jgi:hypothetical protein